MVLNSLSEDKLQASLGCVARFGHFCEIGKFDIQQDSAVGLRVFERNISFHAFDMSEVMYSGGSRRLWAAVRRELQAGLESGEVRPICTSVFDTVTAGLKCISQGRHVGKVLVRVLRDPVEGSAPGLSALRQEQWQHIQNSRLRVLTHYYCPSLPPTPGAAASTGTHLVVGGLGGFGAELVQWLASRGAGDILVLSRPRPGSESHTVPAAVSVPGCAVRVVYADLGQADQCEQLCAGLGDSLVGVWHLGMVLRDVLYAGMTSQQWEEVVRVKQRFCRHLDVYTRLYNPSLQAFVMWSSVTALIGNPGQTNYGYANGSMEAVCRERRSQGLPGVAIQWGIIGKVGVLAHPTPGAAVSLNRHLKYEPQHIDSCLNVSLNHILTQPTCSRSGVVS